MISGSSGANWINLIKPDLIGLTLIIAGCILVSGCENNLQDVKALSGNRNKVTVERSDSVEMIYSDSAIVKNKLIAPVLYHYNSDSKESYYEAKKGITVIFYEPDQKEKARITSDYAIWKEAPKIIELKGNVVAVNPEGSTLKSDEMIWDQEKHVLYSNKQTVLTIPHASGPPTIQTGDGFTSDENLTAPGLIHGRGPITLNQQQGL